MAAGMVLVLYRACSPRVAALSTIETTDGVLVAERRDPAAAFAGTTRSSPWDEFQVAYFHRRGHLELLGRAVPVRPAAGED